MMEGKKLRQADFITSIIFVLFGAWVLFEASRMPMKGTYGGVKNVWYVSPALLPLIIGAGIVVLGIVLMVFSIKTGGAAGVIHNVKHIKLKIGESGGRFIGIILAFVTLVYLFIPRVDFFLSILLFLSYFSVAFYIDIGSIMKKLTAMYLGISVAILLLFATGLADFLNGLFAYSTDIVALVGIIVLNLYARMLCKQDPALRHRYRVAFAISLIVPLVLTPLFRYALLVPLPVEGGIVDLMSLIYFSIR